MVDEDNDEPLARTYRLGRRRIADHFARRSQLGDVLEIAAGTGRLAALYVPHAASAVLLDSSPESLALAARRLPPGTSADVTLTEADVFEWDGQGRRFDTVIFSAWLHHVPHARLERFWQIVDGLCRARRSGVDFRTPGAHARTGGGGGRADLGHRFYAPPMGSASATTTVDGGGSCTNSGTAELSARLADAGWRMEVLGTGLFANMVWATARR